MQTDIKLLSSCVPPLESGRMWCTSCAAVSFPFRLHSSQSGLALMKRSRTFRHARPYRFLVAGSRWYRSYLLASSLACATQNVDELTQDNPDLNTVALVFLASLSPPTQKSQRKDSLTKAFGYFSILILFHAHIFKHQWFYSILSKTILFIKNASREYKSLRANYIFRYFNYIKGRNSHSITFTLIFRKV